LNQGPAAPSVHPMYRFDMNAKLDEILTKLDLIEREIDQLDSKVATIDKRMLKSAEFEKS